jgi:MoaA/NifB/PqqE/SkfB family radical SAM enzyme
MVHGWKLKIIISILKASIALEVFRYARNVRKAKYLLNTIKEKIRQYRGPRSIQKVSFVDGKYYWDMYGEGWPSEGFKRNVARECRRIETQGHSMTGLRNVLLGITTKCPLQCEHCYEWKNLNIPERLSYSDLETIITKLVDHGVGQIHFGGGEPMMRYEDIVKLVNRFSHQVGFWIITSGYSITAERTLALKQAGLTGLCVSLDHHNEAEHNQFRNHRHAFSMAKEAVLAGNKAGLVTSLSLCSTRLYTTEENLNAFAKLARSWGVSFIQILEPEAVGHYEGMDVRLSMSQKKILQDYFLRINDDSHYQDYPIIIYHEYYKPTLGCRGAGNGTFYIDPLGESHPCPFCRHPSGNVLTESIEQCIMRMKTKGCPVDEFRPSQAIMYETMK